MDETHYISVYVDYEYTTEDFFEIFYPTHNFNEINSNLDGSCVLGTFCVTFPH